MSSPSGPRVTAAGTSKAPQQQSRLEQPRASPAAVAETGQGEQVPAAADPTALDVTAVT
jgi:hypothetical protein